MKLSDDFKGHLRMFAFYYANGTLDYELLNHVDYREDLKEEASFVEQAFVIYANNIQMDASVKVLNGGHAMKRAAQFIRFACRAENEDYVVEPRSRIGR